ncbi:MAG: trypsin-like peptidase domain-containing protein [Kiritimatiellae bacterium]|nr:trypsin-like peptidase domain-containing protein [Kiritimatiellia bacterium]
MSLKVRTAGAAIWLAISTAGVADPTNAPAEPPRPPSERNFARLLGDALAGAIERAVPSVVQVKVARHVKRAVVDPQSGELRDAEGVALGIGSGFFFDDQNRVLTAHHVVEGRRVEIVVQTHSGEVLPARLVGADPNTDLAVLAVEAPEGRRYPPLVAGDSDAVRVGEIVIALGAPLGLENTATFGIVSQKGRSVGKLTYESFIQTDASINPGTSGGPVLDADGRWIGVSVMIETTAENAGNVGIGFVVPSAIARRVAEILARHGQMVRSFIGIAPEQMVPSATPLPAGLAEAVRIAKVTAGSPAETAGLKVGDIILRVDGRPTPTLNELKKYMHVHEPGDKVRFEVLRDGTELTIEVTAGAPPSAR